MDQPLTASESGLWGINHRDHPKHWNAWTEWYRDERIKKFCPKNLTTLFEWPPEIPAGVGAVCAWLNEMRTTGKGEIRSTLRPLPVLDAKNHRPWCGRVTWKYDHDVSWGDFPK